MQDGLESKLIDPKGKPEEKSKRKTKRRPRSLETASSRLDPETAMMGITYAGNPRKANPAQCRYLLSSNPGMYKEGYSLGQMPDGLYVFIKTTQDKEIKTAKGYHFPPGTIICREKAYLSEGSAHLLLTRGVNLKPEDIAAAGLILLKKAVIVEWNLRTGTYRVPCKLEEEKASEKVGLPQDTYEPAGQLEPNSPTAAREMRARHYQSGEDLPPSLREQPPKEHTPSPRPRSASTGMVIEILKSSSQSSIASTPTTTTLTPKTSQMPISPSSSLSQSFGSPLHSSKSAETFSSTEAIRNQKIINSPTEATPPAQAITPKTPERSMSSSFSLSQSFGSPLHSSRSAESFSFKKDLKNKQIDSPTATTPRAHTTQPPLISSPNVQKKIWRIK